MGIYIYTLRKQARKSNLGPLRQYKYSERFTSRDYWNGKRYVDEGAAQRGREARHRERWHRYVASGEVTGPIHVCIEFTEGGGVYRQERPVAIWSDCDRIPGQLVGYLRRDGRKWVVDSLESTLLRDRLWLQGYLSQHDLWGELNMGECRRERLASLTAWCRAAYTVCHNHWKQPFLKGSTIHWPNQGTPGRVTAERLEHIRAHIAGAERRLNPPPENMSPLGKMFYVPPRA